MKSDMNQLQHVLVVFSCTMASYGGLAQTITLIGENVSMGMQPETHLMVTGDVANNKAFNIRNKSSITNSVAMESR